MVREEARCKINAFFETKWFLKKCFHVSRIFGKPCVQRARAGGACARAFHFRSTLPSQLESCCRCWESCCQSRVSCRQRRISCREQKTVTVFGKTLTVWAETLSVLRRVQLTRARIQLTRVRIQLTRARIWLSRTPAQLSRAQDGSRSGSRVAGK
jgi:hypothetical protein